MKGERALESAILASVALVSWLAALILSVRAGMPSMFALCGLALLFLGFGLFAVATALERNWLPPATLLTLLITYTLVGVGTTYLIGRKLGIK